MLTPAKFVRRILINFKLNKISKTVEKGQAEMCAESPWVKSYNDRLSGKRNELQQRTSVLYSQLKSDELVLLYLIYFSSIGAKMVQPAEEWLTAWGHGLQKIGFQAIGTDLVEHAKGEVGHDRWHQNDVKYLVKLYNQKFSAALDVQTILDEGSSACVARYKAGFLSTLNGAEYRCLGMLYETELMTFTLAPKFIGYCVQELGMEIMRGLSFLQGHIAADIDHVKENAEQLNQIMTAESNQQKLDEVVALGEETVNLYIDYFEQVMVLAKRQQKQQRELDQRIAV